MLNQHKKQMEGLSMREMIEQVKMEYNVPKPSRRVLQWPEEKKEVPSKDDRNKV
jgi:hypothetical protein